MPPKHTKPQQQQRQQRGNTAKQVAHKAGGSKKSAPSTSGHAKHAKHKHAPGGAKGGVGKDKAKSKAPQGLAATLGGFGGGLLQEALGDLHEAGIKVPQRQPKQPAGRPEVETMQMKAASAPLPALQQPTSQRTVSAAPAPANISSLLGGFKL